MRRRQTKQRGATLVEILVSLAIVTIGLLGLFATISSVSYGSSTSSRLQQAQLRAQTIMEALRTAPEATLQCLQANYGNWGTCETSCVTAQNADMGGFGPANLQSCIFTVDRMSMLPGPGRAGSPTPQDLTRDRSGLRYQLIFDNRHNQARDSFVRRTGLNNRVYEIQITVGWNDDGSDNINLNQPGVHTVTLRSGVFR
jgi:type II secretory pathway pseudopilin PulG